MKNKIVNLGILGIGLLLAFNFSKSLYQMSGAGGRIEETEKKLNEVRLENENLQKKLTEVESEKYLEKQAREKLGLGKEGEMIVILPPASATPAAQPVNNIPNWQKWWKLFF